MLRCLTSHGKNQSCALHNALRKAEKLNLLNLVFGTESLTNCCPSKIYQLLASMFRHFHVKIVGPLHNLPLKSIHKTKICSWRCFYPFYFGFLMSPMCC